MENLIYDAVNNFRSAKQVKSYTKARKKSSAPAKPFPGISLQDSQQRSYFADPFGSRVALAAPFQYSPTSDLSILNGSINGMAPMVLDPAYLPKDEDDVDDDEGVIEQSDKIKAGQDDGGESEDDDKAVDSDSASVDADSLDATSDGEFSVGDDQEQRVNNYLQPTDMDADSLDAQSDDDFNQNYTDDEEDEDSMEEESDTDSLPTLVDITKESESDDGIGLQGGAKTEGEQEWEAFMNDEPEAPRPSKKRGRKPDQLHTIFQGDKQLFEKLMKGEGEVKKYQLLNVTSKQLAEMEEKGEVMKWPVLRTDVPTKAKDKKKPKTDLKKMFGKGCCACGGERVQTSLFRRHNSRDALDVDKMKDFVFFTTDDDDERYDDRGDEQQGYDLDADLIVVDDEDDPLYDILGGMPVGESKKLLKKLKKSNADKDGLFFPGNNEVVLWNFDNIDMH